MRALAFALLFAACTAAAAGASPGDVLRTTADGVAVRERPGDEAPVVARLPKGHKLLEFRRSDEWVKVAVFGMVGRDGWVEASRVRREPRREQAPTEAPPQPEEEAPPAEYAFGLEVDGSPAVEFRAECRTLTAAGTVRRFELHGTIPERYRVRAQALSCTVQKTEVTGRLEVRLLQEEHAIAAAETAAAFNWVRVRSFGPWGPATSIVGDIQEFRVPRRDRGEAPDADREPPARQRRRAPPLPPPLGRGVPPLGRGIPPLQ